MSRASYFFQFGHSSGFLYGLFKKSSKKFVPASRNGHKQGVSSVASKENKRFTARRLIYVLRRRKQPVPLQLPQGRQGGECPRRGLHRGAEHRGKGRPLGGKETEEESAGAEDRRAGARLRAHRRRGGRGHHAARHYLRARLDADRGLRPSGRRGPAGQGGRQAAAHHAGGLRRQRQQRREHQRVHHDECLRPHDRVRRQRQRLFHHQGRLHPHQLSRHRGCKHRQGHGLRRHDL